MRLPQAHGVKQNVNFTTNVSYGNRSFNFFGVKFDPS